MQGADSGKNNRRIWDVEDADMPELSISDHIRGCNVHQPLLCLSVFELLASWKLEPPVRSLFHQNAARNCLDVLSSSFRLAYVIAG